MPLAIVALGVVFGDIGTSPLYALQAVFGRTGINLRVNQNNVYGIISLIIWAVTIVVSIEFLGFIMRADNEGEGGIMSLVTLTKAKLLKHNRLFIILGLLGASLYFGDSIITPAISVLSSVEGLRVATPQLGSLVLPLTVVILILLFYVQKYGSGSVGRIFGPIMFLWFSVIGLGGLGYVIKYPSILKVLSPLTPISFIVNNPIIAFLSLTGVVLAITGAEALYADLGHFGRPPIARAWFFLVFPSLALCYMGEGAFILSHPGNASNILVRLFPSSLRSVFVILATISTVIASQAVISGSFSLVRQSIHLGFLPKMLIKHTSIRESGQIYMPLINYTMLFLVVLLVIIFGSSASLANAYGIAVSGTLAADTMLFLVVARRVWRKSISTVLVMAAIFLFINLLFIASNLQKVLLGGIVPIIIAFIAFLIINTWTKGERIVVAERQAKEGSLAVFVQKLISSKHPVKRIPGEAVYIGHHQDYVPLALRATVDDLHELPEKVVIVTVQTTNAAHVPLSDRCIANDFGGNHEGVIQLTLYYGYFDTVNIPRELKILVNTKPELGLSLDQVSYFISSNKIIPSNRHNMFKWRKSLYCLMSRNSLSTSDFFKLPIKQTEEMQTPLML